MLSIAQCRKILEKNGKPTYSDQQIAQLRQLLYKLGELEHTIYQQYRSCKYHGTKPNRR